MHISYGFVMNSRLNFVDVQCSLNFSDIIIKTFSQNRNQEETEKIRSQRSTMLIWATMVIVLNKATF